jgi:osmoprotectant transport system permease protein
MGGTIISWQALRGGQIDAYPEYTGTIAQEILRNSHQPSFQEIETPWENSALA